MKRRPEVQPRAVLAGSFLLSLCLLALSVSMGVIDPFYLTGSTAGSAVFQAAEMGLAAETDHAAVMGDVPGDSWPGFDGYSRGLLLRTINGTAITLVTVGVLVPLSGIVGLFVGLGAGYIDGASYGQGAAGAILRLGLSNSLRIPNLVLAVVAALVIGPGVSTIPLVLTLILVISFAVVVQTLVRSTMEQEFMHSARFAGANHAYLVRVILPLAFRQVFNHLRVATMTGLGIEAMLSVLAFGPQARGASLGALLKQGLPHLNEEPARSLVPGLVLIVVLGSAVVLARPVTSLWVGEAEPDPRLVNPSPWRRRPAGL